VDHDQEEGKNRRRGKARWKITGRRMKSRRKQKKKESYRKVRKIWTTIRRNRPLEVEDEQSKKDCKERGRLKEKSSMEQSNKKKDEEKGKD